MPDRALHLRRPDQKVVERLVSALGGTSDEQLLAVRARARSLPTMLRRHGPIQVLLFLQAKAGDDGTSSDRRLAAWLLEGIASLLPPPPHEDATAYATRLAGMALDGYLLHWQTSIEVSAWLKRLIEARTHKAPPSGSPPLGDLSEGEDEPSSTGPGSPDGISPGSSA